MDIEQQAVAFLPRIGVAWRLAVQDAGDCHAECPTCREIADEFPGIVELSGDPKRWVLTDLGHVVVGLLKGA